MANQGCRPRTISQGLAIETPLSRTAVTGENPTEEHVISIKEARVLGFHRRFHQDEDCLPEDQVHCPSGKGHGRKREGEFEGPCHGSSSPRLLSITIVCRRQREGEFEGPCENCGHHGSSSPTAPLHYRCLERGKSLALSQGFPHRTRG